MLTTALPFRKIYLIDFFPDGLFPLPQELFSAEILPAPKPDEYTERKAEMRALKGYLGVPRFFSPTLEAGAQQIQVRDVTACSVTCFHAFCVSFISFSDLTCFSDYNFSSIAARSVWTL